MNDWWRRLRGSGRGAAPAAPTRPVPRDRRLDATRALLADPYGYVAKRCRRHRSDLFRARLFLRDTICMSGPAAARLFYEPGRLVRGGAAPSIVRTLLYGVEAVQTLDGAAHRGRKQLLLALLGPRRIAELLALVDEEWELAAGRWARLPEVVLYDELQLLFARAACHWAGLPVSPVEIRERAQELAALFDLAWQGPLARLRARRARTRLDRWLVALVERVRAGELEPSPGSALAVLARHHEAGRALPAAVAAAELLNLLRPTVALAVPVVHAAHAVVRHPELAARLRAAEPGYAAAFAREVLRHYPFVPLVAAQVGEPFEWRGRHFAAGQRVLLDLYGTNHDARCWSAAEQFDPERFRGAAPPPFAWVPFGAGDALGGHRCAGEALALGVLERSLDVLARRLAFAVPSQDLRLDFARVPALPHSRLLLHDVRLAAAPPAGDASRAPARPAESPP